MNLKTRSLATLLILLNVLLLSCKDKPQLLEEGRYRGVFTTQNKPIPFNFSVEDDTAGTIKVFLVNGKEKTALDSVQYQRDSVLISIEVYDAILVARIKDDTLKGYFRKNQVARQGIPFLAVRGDTSRFDVKNQSTAALEGKWSVNLINEKNEARYTVGLLQQKGNLVTGTILTTTGDYRYLQGVVDGDSLKLSGFGGSNPSLLVAKLVDDRHLFGDFISPGGKVRLEAVRSDTAKLPDPYSLTYLQKGYDKLSFSFPDLTGKPVSLEDEKYKGKVVVVTIKGTWCPNCVDEAAFLSPWYKKNRERGVEIVGLSFERKDDLNFARERIGKFIKHFDVQYDILFAGLADKAQAGTKLPALNAVLSFPTTIFIDRQGKVRKIHTGFTGPATGEHYQQFIDAFNKDIDQLLNETNGV
ncbi:Peroxiredoxin [Chryseolinea serpens]|uniref:Peroxiredoxin n=1 Tax=Chryseolinea serpens TaxID=947013 RepID=A0A1M5XTI4_9BACT|nr:TlpA disulfide reductase family protein [Chryseolinea serpens]SHI03121.1 Peroxiredoxin [Chryseolinea serpens]